MYALLLIFFKAHTKISLLSQQNILKYRFGFMSEHKLSCFCFYLANVRSKLNEKKTANVDFSYKLMIY